MRTHKKHRFSDFVGKASVFVATVLFISPHVAAVTFVISLYTQSA